MEASGQRSKKRPLVLAPILVVLTLAFASCASGPSGRGTAVTNIGTVSGQLELVGGPSPGARDVPGFVVFNPIRQTGQAEAVGRNTTSQGTFTVTLLPGSYRVHGYSPKYKVDGQEPACNAANIVIVKPRSVVNGINVVCSVK